MKIRRTVGRAVVLVALLGCVDPYDVATQVTPVAEVRVGDEPTTVIGQLEGPDEYLLDGVMGAARMDDGSVIVVVGMAAEVRRYDATGQFVWKSGRKGPGPGEYNSPDAPHGCISDRGVFVYDWENRRVTVLDIAGQLLDTWQTRYPVVTFACAPGGRFAFVIDSHTEPRIAGPYRSTQALMHWEGDESSAVLVRDDIPAEDRWSYVEEGLEPISGPRPLGKEMVFATTADGVWLSTADSYEIEFVTWSGRTTRVVRWTGPDLAITARDIEARRERYYAYNLERRQDETWRSMIDDGWRDQEAQLPDSFPSVRRVLVPRDGGVWVQHYYRTSNETITWQYFDEDDKWAGTLILPPNWRILDIGQTWMLVRIPDELGRQRLFVYPLSTSADDGEDRNNEATGAPARKRNVAHGSWASWDRARFAPGR